jgi:ABC-type branched-subunit amino acid transport system ATPase component/branched-subunit amino acid ABC-type transport system permease component
LEKFLNLAISGAVAGAIYSIMASGLVLTYQTSGIFNFAQGAVAFVTAFLFFQLNQPTSAGGLGWPIVPAAIVSIAVFAPLLGLLLDRILLRRLAQAPVYARIVGTVGLLIALPALALWLVTTVGNKVLDLGLPENAPGFDPPGLGPTPRRVVWRPLDGVAINSNQLAVFLAAGLAALLLWLVLRHTRIGLQMRAGVDRRDLAALRGVDPGRVSAVAWTMTMALAGLGGVLLAPLFGLTDLDFTFVVLGSLAAVVLSGLRSIPIAFVGGLLLGIIQNLAFGYAPDVFTDISGFQSSIPFVLTVLLIFFVLGRERGRAAGSVAEEAPPPDHRAGLPMWRRMLPWAIALGALLVFQLWLADDFWAGLISRGLVLAIVFLSFVVVTGLGGMVSLAQATFVTASAFTVGWLVNHTWSVDVPIVTTNGRTTFVFALLAGAAAAAAIGALVAIPVRRLGALALALATLALAFVADLTLFQLDSVRNGSRGWAVPHVNRDFTDIESFGQRNLSFGPFDFVESRQLAVLALVVFGLLTLLLHNLRRSPSGRAMLAVRSSEVAARTVGIAPTRAKVALFALSAGIAGLGGGLLAIVNSPVNNASTPAFIGLIWLAVTVTFGIRRPGGALLAGLAFATVSALLELIAGWRFMPDFMDDLAGSSSLPAILFGLGAINLAKNPDGVLALAGFRRREKQRERAATRAAPPPVPVTAPLPPVVVSEPARDGAAPPALELAGIAAGYGEVEVLHGVDLAVPRGRVVALLGANGAGKSTLCAVAAGLLEPTRGRILRDGEDVTGKPAHARARSGLLLAPEARGVFPGLTVDENLALLLRSAAERSQAYERFPLLAARKGQLAGLLSGGEQQMLALAAALVRPPEVLVADEPSLGLAPLATEEVFRALAQLREAGCALLLVEEKARDALELADTVVFMELGRIAWSGPQAAADVDRLAAAYLGVRA